MIQGVEIEAENYDKLKDAIMALFADDKTKENIDKIFKQNIPIKNLIASIAVSMGQYGNVDKKVKKVTPKFNKLRKDLAKLSFGQNTI